MAIVPQRKVVDNNGTYLLVLPKSWVDAIIQDNDLHFDNGDELYVELAGDDVLEIRPIPKKVTNASKVE